MEKVVLLSGGIDSTTCLAMALTETTAEQVLAVNVSYGQRHKKEMQSAKNVAEYYGVELMEIDLSEIFRRSNCPLLEHSGGSIEHGDYAQQKRKNGVVSTYVPFRNGLMLSAVASIALSVGASEVWYGAHADDAAGNAYPDCSQAFTDAMNMAIREGSADQVRLVAPLVEMTKAEVVKTGLELDAPYYLTWSCYEGGEEPCGKCGTCIDREKAFKLNGVEDPARKVGNTYEKNQFKPDRH